MHYQFPKHRKGRFTVNVRNVKSGSFLFHFININFQMREQKAGDRAIIVLFVCLGTINDILLFEFAVSLHPLTSKTFVIPAIAQL